MSNRQITFAGLLAYTSTMLLQLAKLCKIFKLASNVSECLKLKFFWGSMPPDPPRYGSRYATVISTPTLIIVGLQNVYLVI